MAPRIAVVRGMLPVNSIEGRIDPFLTGETPVPPYTNRPLLLYFFSRAAQRL
jgi:hypothetical protein